ncbi:MAG: DUF3500 domain-containing protein [Cyclobacteriaceae bacterium]
MSLVLLTLGCGSDDTSDVDPTDTGDGTIASSANILLDKLTSDGVDLTNVQYNFDTEQWKNWTNVSVREFPRSNGIRFRDMSAEQEELAQSLLKTSFSDQGYTLITAIHEANVWTDERWQEQQVAAVGDPFGGFHADNSYLTFFGTPSATEPQWGYRLNGHHIGFNVVFRDDAITYTPVFIGADFRSKSNPAAIDQEMPYHEELITAAESFYNSLSSAQQSTANSGLSDRPNLKLTPANPVPEADVRNADYLADNTNGFPYRPDEENLEYGYSKESYEMNFGDGLSLSELDESQTSALTAIVETFVGTMIDEFSAVEMATILDKWNSGVFRQVITEGSKMYYSIYIPDVVAIEFWNAEAERHYHASWSTPGRNYGGLFDDAGGRRGRSGGEAIKSSEILRHLSESDHHRDHSHDETHRH